MLLLCLIIASGLGIVSGCKSNPPPPNKPPTIRCYNPSYVQTAGKNANYKRVYWSNPSASDPDGSVSVRLTSGRWSGSYFYEGTHTVSYTAEDNKGLKDYCSFSFRVEVRRCRARSYLANGNMNCGGRIYGNKCHYSCNSGYRLSGSSSSECGWWDWSTAVPNCVAKNCSPYVKPANAKAVKCSNGQRVGSKCWLECDGTNGWGARAGEHVICQEDEKWNALNLRCYDVQPPTIHNCPTHTEIQTKDPNSDTTIVHWPEITVTDNAGPVVLKNTHGSAAAKQGVFLEGTWLVKFSAEDSSGNKATECSFSVTVQSVVCDPPVLQDKNIDTPGCVDFHEGKSCQVRCYLALRRQGKEYITCKKDKSAGNAIKGYWDWGQHENPPQPEPSCPMKTCPKLRPPDNGALACEKWFLGTQCIPNCDSNYDVPQSVVFTTMLFLCRQSTATWNFDKPPNCAWREPGSKLNMPSYFYFTGDCSANKDNIKQNFLQVIEKFKICPQPQFCKIENVDVTCGDKAKENEWDWKRKKRALRRRSQSQYIKFHVSVGTDQLSGNFSTQMDMATTRLSAVARDVGKLSFQVAGRTITANKTVVRDPVPICTPGLMVGYFHKDSCVPCPVGSFHNATRDECLACQLGQFQDKEGQSTCQSCPAGETTITIANVNSSACAKMCKAGNYSSNGVVPCAKCPRGTYQPNQNATKCIDCPVGTTTEAFGSTSSSDCFPYDILVNGPVTVPIEASLPVQICDFTFSVWIKIAETLLSGIKFEVTHPDTGSNIEIEVSTKGVDVYINKDHQASYKEMLNTKWVNIGAIWAGKTLTIYKNGISVKSEALPYAQNCPGRARSVMKLGIRDNAYLYLKDMTFLTSSKPDLMPQFAQSCAIYNKQSLYTLEHIDIHSEVRLNEVIPSTCLKPDICDTNPCGDNLCIPRKDGFICACKAGYTGDKCEIPPDFCKGSLCNNNATCIKSGSSFQCDCKPGFRGTLCEDTIDDGGWSKWMDWGACTTTCGKGYNVRFRFCTNPPPDREGKDCDKTEAKEYQVCDQQECPACTQSTLVLGDGVIPTCETKGEEIHCDIKCKVGKVLPERPFRYICSKGFWSPTRQTVSCTDPVTPLKAGINYTIVFNETVTSHDQVQNLLTVVGQNFKCKKENTCELEVGSAACSDRVKVCESYSGIFYGSLIVRKSVPQGTVDVASIQQSDNPFLKPLFYTWEVFKHVSTETDAPLHRALDMKLVDNRLMVFPYTDPSKSAEVPGQFGKIMTTWLSLDQTNWEVRNLSYSPFDVTTSDGPEKPVFLSATQDMTCPTGSVQGGVFCIKCPPGKQYVDGRCEWCPRGFYQGWTGQSTCQSCLGFQTTENIGSNDKSQCLDTNVSELKMLLSGSNFFTVFDLKSVVTRTVYASSAPGKIDHLVYNPRDGLVYFSSISQSALGKIKLDGNEENIFYTFPPDVMITGLGVDIGSEVTIYTTADGRLGALDVKTGAKHTILDNLNNPRDLVLDQHFGVYWIENDKIKYVQYSGDGLKTILTEEDTVWNVIIDKKADRLLWLSNTRLRTSTMNGTNVQTLTTKFTSRFGQTDLYYFYISSEHKLMRQNKDLTAITSVYDMPPNLDRMHVVNTTDEPSIEHPCLANVKDCNHGCLPLSKELRTCFCKKEFTLQSDLNSCRQDFQLHFNTNDPTQWYVPNFILPPSQAVRFKVLSCKLARISLAESNTRYYILELGKKRNNITEVSLQKAMPSGVKVVLKEKNIDLLACSALKTMWVSWKAPALLFGYGDTIGQNVVLRAPDSNPYTINSLRFGIGINSTAAWQI